MLRTTTSAFDLSRRQALWRLLLSGGMLVSPGSLFAAVSKHPPAGKSTGSGKAAGVLQPADSNGVRLPAGFRSRIVAQSGNPVVAGSNYIWHQAPDGGAVFASGDGGWIYVSNSETILDRGGAGAIRFAADGALIDAYAILSDTNANCAGGPTPWNTWLSCEEIAIGKGKPLYGKETATISSIICIK
jgi:hypothetical protein